MAEVELRVVADRRDALLLELGRIILGGGFAMLRPRLADCEDGVTLDLQLKGPDSGLPALQSRLREHPRVRSVAIRSADATRRSDPPRDDARATHAVASASTESTHEPTSVRGVPPSGAAADLAPSPARVEALLAVLAREFPDVLAHVVAFEREVSPTHRARATRYAGSRLGAWMYKRDYARGAPLDLADFVRKIAVPAIRTLLRGADFADGEIRVRESPLVGTGLHRHNSCHFLRGCLEGLLGEAAHLGKPRVMEAACRNSGDPHCRFTFHA